MVVAVTGAAGYVASHIVRELLDNGHQVHGTVRSLVDDGKISHLKKMQNAHAGRLKLFEADLLKPGNFKEAFEGAEFVIHAASPFQVRVEDPDRDLVQPAVQGTKNVIGEALKSPTVRRIVLTSSMAAIRGDRPDSHVYTETDWNDTASIKTPYPYSKTLAEKETWAMMKEANRESDLVTICPTLVFGPPLSNRQDATSIKVMLAILRGDTSGLMGGSFGTVDVREVAHAHVAALDVSKVPSGRYIVTQTEVSAPVSEVINDIRSEYSSYPIPKPEALKSSGAAKALRINRDKSIRVLGVKYRPRKETMLDMAAALVATKMV